MMDKRAPNHRLALAWGAVLLAIGAVAFGVGMMIHSGV
jgi:hypothetical protein